MNTSVQMYRLHRLNQTARYSKFYGLQGLMRVMSQKVVQQENEIAEKAALNTCKKKTSPSALLHQD